MLDDLEFQAESSLSPEQCHEHSHSHNRYNPMGHIDPWSGPFNNYTDHHNPWDNSMFTEKGKVHDHKHCHQGSRIGHDPEKPDDLGDHVPLEKYDHVPNEPWTPYIRPME